MFDAFIVLFAALLILVVVAWQAALMAKTARQQAATARPTKAQVAATHVAKGRTDVTGRVIDYLRSRVWARRALSLSSALAALVAFGFLAFPAYTNLVQDRIQDRLRHQLTSPEHRQKYLEHRVGEGESLTRIRIPAIDIDVVVVEGTGPDALRAGAGHYRSTPLPCENGNVAIAGHRTTYGKPFANIDLLNVGDEITLETPIGSCTYKVNASPPDRAANDDHNSAFVVEPTAVSVVGPTAGPMLTLTTCHPKGSAAQRLIIQAALVSQGGPAQSQSGS